MRRRVAGKKEITGPVVRSQEALPGRYALLQRRTENPAVGVNRPKSENCGRPSVCHAFLLLPADACGGGPKCPASRCGRHV